MCLFAAVSADVTRTEQQRHGGCGGSGGGGDGRAAVHPAVAAGRCAVRSVPAVDSCRSRTAAAAAAGGRWQHGSCGGGGAAQSAGGGRVTARGSGGGGAADVGRGGRGGGSGALRSGGAATVYVTCRINTECAVRYACRHRPSHFRPATCFRASRRVAFVARTHARTPLVLLLQCPFTARQFVPTL